MSGKHIPGKKSWSNTYPVSGLRQARYHGTQKYLEMLRRRNLKKYGMTIKDYDALLRQQGGRCAICRSLPGAIRLAVDHVHGTQVVRGLLCAQCNVLVSEHVSPELLRRIACYVSQTVGNGTSVPTK